MINNNPKFYMQTMMAKNLSTIASTDILSLQSYTTTVIKHIKSVLCIEVLFRGDGRSLCRHFLSLCTYAIEPKCCVHKYTNTIDL